MKHGLAGLFAFLVLSNIALAGQPDWTIRKDVPYGPHQEEKADLYLLNSGVHPAVLFIHGGAWKIGDKKFYKGYYAEKYANAGYHVIAINYRLLDKKDPSTQWPAQMQDVQLAVRWIRSNAAQWRIDPTRIVAIGSSAGGHLALLLGTYRNIVPGDRADLLPNISPAVRAVGDNFGLSDLTQGNVLALALFGGRTYPQDPDGYRAASPVYHVDPLTAPTCIAHGTRDDVVSISQSTELVARLNDRQVPNQRYWFNGGHSFSGLSPAERDAADNAILRCISSYK